MNKNLETLDTIYTRAHTHGISREKIKNVWTDDTVHQQSKRNTLIKQRGITL